MEYYTLDELAGFWSPKLSRNTAQRLVSRYGRDTAATKINGRWQIPSSTPKIVLHEVLKKECPKVWKRVTPNFGMPDVQSDATPTAARRTTALPLTVERMLERLCWVPITWIGVCTGIPRGTLNTAINNNSRIRKEKGPVRIHRDDIMLLIGPYIEERARRDNS